MAPGGGEKKKKTQTAGSISTSDSLNQRIVTRQLSSNMAAATATAENTTGNISTTLDEGKQNKKDDSECLKLLHELTKKITGMDTKLTKIEDELATINQTQVTLDRKITKINHELDEIKTSQEAISDMFDDCKRELDTARQEIRILTTENKSLKETVHKFQKQLEDSVDEIDKLNAYSRRDCLEISGIPVIQNEKTDEIVFSVARKMGITLDKNDISVSHRMHMPSKGHPRIIAKFVHRRKRDEFYNERRNVGNTNELDYSRYTTNKIFINESLTPRGRELFRRCHSFKKEHNFAYLWTKNGRIFLRATSNSQKLPIDNIEDLAM